MYSVKTILGQSKFKSINATLLLILIAQLISCNDAIQPSPAPEGNGTLHISTRTTEGKVEIPMPMHIYIFNSNQICAYGATITSPSSKLSAALPAGLYSITILAGADIKNYDIPDRTLATLASVITLRDDKTTSHQRLAWALANVDIKFNELTNVDMELTHLVAEASAIVKNVPDDAKAIGVTIGELHNSFSLNGTYNGNSNSANLLCSRDKVTGDWIANATYILPSNASSVPITVRVLQGNGATETLKYASSSAPQANQAFQISANYANGGNFSLGVKCKSWGSPIKESFNFDTENIETEQIPEMSATSLPIKHSIWEGAFVAEVTSVTPNSAILLLMSIHEWASLTAEEIELQARTYNAAGGKGWSVPTNYHVNTLRDARKVLGIGRFDELLKSAGGDAISSAGYTLCRFWETGEYGKFNFSASTISSYDGTSKLRLRAIKRVKVNF